jgi:recombination protein RecT
MKKAFRKPAPPSSPASPSDLIVKALTPAQILNARRLLFKKELVKRTDTFSDLLPKHISATKFINMVLNACVNNTTLLQCTPTSILTSAMRSAQLGLLPDNNGEAHLIPFNNPKKNNQLEAQFLPGYRGLVQLALRSGQVRKFQPRAVYQGDEFDYAYGTEEYIKHKPLNLSEQISHVYAVLEFTNGGKMFDVMTLQEIEAVRNDAPEWKGTPEKDKKNTFWVLRFSDMAKKTVIRKLAKYAPISPEFQFAVSLDEKIEVIGESQIGAESINWDELTEQQQEEVLHDLLKSDTEKKELLLKNALIEKGEKKKQRNKNILEATENLVNE